MRDELLNGEIFYSLKEAQVLIEMWRNHYNTIRPRTVHWDISPLYLLQSFFSLHNSNKLD